VQVIAIHIAPGSRLPVRRIEAVTAEAGKGLVGDRYPGATRPNLTVDAGEIPTRVLTSGTIRVGDTVGLPVELAS